MSHLVIVTIDEVNDVIYEYSCVVEILARDNIQNIELIGVHRGTNLGERIPIYPIILSLGIFICQAYSLINWRSVTQNVIKNNLLVCLGVCQKPILYLVNAKN
jgi:hypothetical protein